MLVAYSITYALQSSAFLLVLLNTSVAFAHIHVQNMHRTFFWILWKSGWRYFSWRVLFLLIRSLFGNPYLWVTRSLPWWNHTCQYLAWFNKYETRIKHVPGFFISTFAMIIRRDGGWRQQSLKIALVLNLTFDVFGNYCKWFLLRQLCKSWLVLFPRYSSDRIAEGFWLLVTTVWKMGINTFLMTPVPSVQNKVHSAFLCIVLSQP